MKRTLTREEVIKLSQLLHGMDEEHRLVFVPFLPKGACRAFFEAYYISTAIDRNGKTLFMVHYESFGQYFVYMDRNTYPELAALCDWLNRRAESGNESPNRTNELFKLLEIWRNG